MHAPQVSLARGGRRCRGLVRTSISSTYYIFRKASEQQVARGSKRSSSSGSSGCCSWGLARRAPTSTAKQVEPVGERASERESARLPRRARARAFSRTQRQQQARAFQAFAHNHSHSLARKPVLNCTPPTKELPFAHQRRRRKGLRLSSCQRTLVSQVELARSPVPLSPARPPGVCKRASVGALALVFASVFLCLFVCACVVCVCVCCVVFVSSSAGRPA